MKALRPKISVVIPTIDRHDYLREALVSIRDQSLAPAEILISDNAPKQPADFAAAEFPDLPIRHVRHHERLEVDAHWLWAFGAAKGDYVTLLEDDNLWRKDHLESVISALEANPSVPVACSGAFEFRERISALQLPINAPMLTYDIVKEEPVVLDWLAAAATFLFNTDATSSAFAWRKDVFDTVAPISPAVRSAHDRWLWAQLSVLGGMVYIPKITVLYRQHDAMLSQALDGARYRREQSSITRKIRALIDAKGETSRSAFLALKPFLTDDGPYLLAKGMWRDRDQEIIAEMIPLLLGTSSKSDLILPLSKMTAELGTALASRRLKRLFRR